MNLASILNTTTPLFLPYRNISDRQGLHADMVRYAAAMLYAEHLRSSLCSRVEDVIPVKAHDRVLIGNIRDLINPSDFSTAIAKAGCILKAHPPQVAEGQKTAEPSVTAFPAAKSTVLRDGEPMTLSPIHIQNIENAAFSFAIAFCPGNANSVPIDVDTTQATPTTTSPRNLKCSLSSDTSNSTLVEASSSSSTDTDVSSRPAKFPKMRAFSAEPTDSTGWRVIQYSKSAEPFSASTDSIGWSVVKYSDAAAPPTPQAPVVERKSFKRPRSDENEDNVPTASTSSESTPTSEVSSRPSKIRKTAPPSTIRSARPQPSPLTPPPATTADRKLKLKVPLSPAKEGARRSSARLAASRPTVTSSKLTLIPRTPVTSVSPALSPRASPSAAGDASPNWKLSTRRAENNTFRIILRPSPEAVPAPQLDIEI